MRTKKKSTTTRRTVLIDGILYHADRPHDCRVCYFWKNNKTGCTLGRSNCYYLAESVMTEQEKKCESCPFAKGKPCVTLACYRDLNSWLHERRETSQKKGGPAYV